MSRGIVLFQSKYGATRRYAQWLAEATGFDLAETKTVTPGQLAPYDVVVLGGGVYASGIAGLSVLKKNIQQLKDKQIAVFAVGASPYDEKALEQIRALHFKDALQAVPLFYCRGAWNEEQMSWRDRALCALLKKAVAKQDPESYEPWQRALVEAAGQCCDWTDKAYLRPLLAFLGQGGAEAQKTSG